MGIPEFFSRSWLPPFSTLIFCTILLSGLVIPGVPAATTVSPDIQKVVITTVPVTAATFTCDAASQCMAASAANATWGYGGYVQTSTRPCGYLPAMTAVAAFPEYCFQQRPVRVVAVINTSRSALVTTTSPACPAILSVTSIPTGALVLVDGTSYGTTPLTRAHVDPGQRLITVSMAGYSPASERVSLLCDTVYNRKYSLAIAPAGEGVQGAGSSLPVAVQQVPVQVVNRSAVPPITTAQQPVAPVLPREPVTGTCSRRYAGSGNLSTGTDGRLNCTTLISSDDGILVLSVPGGTLVENTGMNPVPAISIAPVTPGELPASTDGGRWTGKAYHFLPGQTTFDPPALVSFTLDEGTWERSDPANLSIRQTAPGGTGFEALKTTIDPATRTASAPVRHFSIIGLFSTGPGTGPSGPLPAVIRDAVRSSRGPLPLSPLVPDAYAPIAAVAAGILVSLLGSLLSTSASIAQAWERITSLVKNFLGSETVGLVSTSEIEKRGIKPSEGHRILFLGLSCREILVIAVSAIGFAAAFLIADSVDVDVVTVTVFLCAGGIATILHDLAHKFCATRCGCVTEYQFWSLGTATMLATAWLFGNAFAKPSRSVIQGGRTLLPEEAARIRLAGPLMSMGIAVVSLFLIPLGGLFAVAGSAGFSMNLLNSVFSLVPVKPNDGVEIFAWNRLVWAGTFIPLLVFFLFVYLS